MFPQFFLSEAIPVRKKNVKSIEREINLEILSLKLKSFIACRWYHIWQRLLVTVVMLLWCKGTWLIWGMWRLKTLFQHGEVLRNEHIVTTFRPYRKKQIGNHAPRRQRMSHAMKHSFVWDNISNWGWNKFKFLAAQKNSFHNSNCDVYF